MKKFGTPIGAGPGKANENGFGVAPLPFDFFGLGGLVVGLLLFLFLFLCFGWLDGGGLCDPEPVGLCEEGCCGFPGPWG